MPVANSLCRFCHRRERYKAKQRLVCEPCMRQRHRKPKCASCTGPTYGLDNFCEKCSPRRPNRQKQENEVSLTLISPSGLEREVYREPGINFYVTKGVVIRIGKTTHKEFYVFDVSWRTWLSAGSLAISNRVG